MYDPYLFITITPIYYFTYLFHSIITFNESNLRLGFTDAITLGQVEENLQFIKDTAKSVCNREMNVQLTLNDKPRVSGVNLVNKKKLYNKNRQKTEENRFCQ